MASTTAELDGARGQASTLLGGAPSANSGPGVAAAAKGTLDLQRKLVHLGGQNWDPLATRLRSQALRGGVTGFGNELNLL